MQKLDNFVKIAAAAKFLGIADNTLRSWADSGKVPSVRNPANGYRLFKQRDLKKFLHRLERSAERNWTQ